MAAASHTIGIKEKPSFTWKWKKSFCNLFMSYLSSKFQSDNLENQV